MPDAESAPRQFAEHLPAIGAATAGSVLAALLGSFLGTAGTMAGLAIGSAASGTCAWWAERGIRRANAAAKAKAEAVRGKSPPPGTPATPQPAAARHGRSTRRLGTWSVIVLGALACSVFAVTAVEHVAGKPLSYVVQDKTGHGTTLGGGSDGSGGPASTPPASPSGAVSTPSGAASAAPSSAQPSAPATSPGATPTAPAGSEPPAPVQSSEPLTPVQSAASPAASAAQSQLDNPPSP